MRNTLQYLYSISVLLGVFVTSYLMIDREGSARFPIRAIQPPPLTNRAAVGANFEELFELQDNFEKFDPRNPAGDSRQNKKRTQHPSNSDWINLPEIK